MSCCSTTPDPAGDAQTARCPRCGERGRRVKPITLSSLLKPEVVPAGGLWRFCRTPQCPVVYFGDQELLLAEHLTVPVGCKEVRPARPICYCFGYSAADIEAAARRPRTVFQIVSERCKRGEDRCEETNPQGACCLGNIRALEKHALAAPPQEASCCSR